MTAGYYGSTEVIDAHLSGPNNKSAGTRPPELGTDVHSAGVNCLGGN